VPIPNTAVKPRAANGSRTIGPARVGHCQVYGPKLLSRSFGPFFCPALPPARAVSAGHQLEGGPPRSEHVAATSRRRYSSNRGRGLWRTRPCRFLPEFSRTFAGWFEVDPENWTGRIVNLNSKKRSKC